MARWTRKLAGQNVWIIGASSGIGAALAQELKDRGANVAISARREEKLDEVAQGEMVVVPADAGDAKALAKATTQVRKKLGSIDTVVWCAAYWGKSDATNWDREEYARHVNLNLLGLNDLLAEVLPTMVDEGRGHIVGIASVAGFRGFPGAEAYGSTKAAQLALFESLRASLHHTGVHVTTVAPGFVKTDLTAKNDFPMPFIIETDEAARSIARGIKRGQLEIVFPFRMALAMKIARLLPVRWWNAAMRPKPKN